MSYINTCTSHHHRHALGFLTNPKRFNVATTRAMCLLIVIGHPGVLVGCPNWRALLTFCCDKGACVGVPVPPTVGGDGGGGDGGNGGGGEGGGRGGGGGGSNARAEVDASLERMSRRPDDDDDDDNGDDGDESSAHIQQAAVGFVREE